MNSIIEAIYNHGLNNPDKLCLIDQNSKLSYFDFFSMVKKYAYTFSNEYKITKGDAVIVECNQVADYFLVEFSLHLIGAIFVPLETKCAETKILSVLELCNAKLVILKNKRDIEGINNIIDYVDLKDNLSESLEDYVLPSEDTVSEILFSTGTTGKEKGIVITHKNDVAVAENILYGVDMQEDNVEIMPLPINHSHGLRSCYANLLNGSTLVLLESIANVSFIQTALDEYKANAIDLVPSALSVLLKLTRNLLSNYADQIRYIEFGSAALLENDKKKIQDLLPKSNLYNFYGSTESGRSIVYNFKKGNEKEKCIGKPTHNVKLAILDENFNEIENSSLENAGKIATAGPMNMSCYYKDEEETKKAFFNEYVVSSDLAYIDEDGDVILLGRAGDVINIGGKKVSPEEIENIAKQIKGVEDCACIPIVDAMLGQAPKLFVQVKKSSGLDEKAIKSYLTDNLEKFKVPKVIEFIDKVPRTFNGKINKKVLH